MGFSPISFEVDGIGFEHESSCVHLKTIPTELVVKKLSCFD